MKINKILEIFKDFKRSAQKDILAIFENQKIDNSILEQLYTYSNLQKENTQFLKLKEKKIKPYYLTIMIEDLSASAQKFLYFILKYKNSIGICNELFIGKCTKDEIDRYILEKKEVDLIKEIKSSRFKSITKSKSFWEKISQPIYKFASESKVDNDYGIKPLKEIKSKKSIHIFVNGFRNDEKGNNFKDWENTSSELFSNDASLYGFDWPNGKMNSFSNILLKVGIKLLKVGIKSKGNIILGISSIVSVISEWKQARDHAEEYSPKLAKFIKEEHDKNQNIKIYLYGHSLGARLIYFTLENLANSNIEIEEVFFFGGAVHIDDISATDILRFTKNIYNFYSYNDDILGYIYKIAEIGEEPIGLYEIKCKNSQEKIGNLYNISVNEFVAGHTEYIKNFDTLYRRKYRREEYC